VADVSVPNPNVYYEIGLTTALGKPVFMFKQKGVQLPADFGGVHYYEYDLVDLAAGAQDLTTALEKWAQHADHQPFGVKHLEDR
jgi:predicted nucleotide-binding protein